MVPPQEKDKGKAADENSPVPLNLKSVDDLVTFAKERREVLAFGALGIWALAYGSAVLNRDSRDEPVNEGEVKSQDEIKSVKKMRERVAKLKAEELTKQEARAASRAVRPPQVTGVKPSTDTQASMGEGLSEGGERITEVAASARDEMKEARQQVVDAGEELKQVGQQVAEGAASAYGAAKTVGAGVVAVATTAYKTGVTMVETVDATLDVVVPAAQEVAAKAAPVIQKGVDTAIPLVQEAYTKASPVIQEAYTKASPYIEQALDAPALRTTTEAIDKFADSITSDPNLSGAVAQTKASYKVASAAAVSTLPFWFALGDMLAAAAVWWAKFLGTFAGPDGADGAKVEILSTLKYQAGSAAQATRDIVLPAMKEYVVPAVKQAGEVGVKALGEAAKSALETPNGQVLTQKVTGTLTEISSQQAAVVEGVKGAVEGVSGAVSGAVDSQKEAVVQGVKGAVEGVTEGVKDSLAPVMRGVQGSVSGVVHGVQTQRDAALSNAGDTVQGVTQGIKGSVSGALQGLREQTEAQMRR